MVDPPGTTNGRPKPAASTDLQKRARVASLRCPILALAQFRNYATPLPHVDSKSYVAFAHEIDGFRPQSFFGDTHLAKTSRTYAASKRQRIATPSAFIFKQIISFKQLHLVSLPAYRLLDPSMDTNAINPSGCRAGNEALLSSQRLDPLPSC